MTVALLLILVLTWFYRASLLRSLILWGLRKDWHDENGEARSWTTRVIVDPLTGEPYLSRFYFPRLFGHRPMLHYFHKADTDRHLHNHPWIWAFSLILVGSYDEELLIRKLRVWDRSGKGRLTYQTDTRRVRWFNFIESKSFHKIEKLHGDVFTLFIAGPRTKNDQWGFLTENGFVSSDKYFNDRKNAA